MILKRPEKIENVIEKIKECIESGNYIVSKHALDRQEERIINLPMMLHVLKTGYEEKKKTSFDEKRNTWKYAIRGKTIRNSLDIRVIVAFDHNDMLVVTVMYVEKI